MGLFKALLLMTNNVHNKRVGKLEQQQGKWNTQETIEQARMTLREQIVGQWIGLKTLLLIDLRIYYPIDWL